MSLRAAIELDIFNIIANAGFKAKLSAVEIVEKIPTTNPNAAITLDRILRLLSINSLLSMSQRPCQSGDNATHQEKCYGLTQLTRHLATVEVRNFIRKPIPWKVKKAQFKQQEESTLRPYLCSDFQQKRPLKIQHNPVKELGWDTQRLPKARDPRDVQHSVGLRQLNKSTTKYNKRRTNMSFLSTQWCSKEPESLESDNSWTKGWYLGEPKSKNYKGKWLGKSST